jgi:hypothetical protein
MWTKCGFIGGDVIQINEEKDRPKRQKNLENK